MGIPGYDQWKLASPDDDYIDDGDMCVTCGGEGWIMEEDGDPSDWGEDTYCGEEDAAIVCRHCGGKGTIK